ncbi:VUT family protein [Methanosarcina sp. MSH10X1]|uniref:queuosine precursor transporter n=1 Tax=Methanosarcina sp. MSH10X1 TaxID=2507075 RepID=UPI000FFB8CB8|nr:queuosine precursor transporter [Methanosarcina sp. MSH10X1]RXA20550.1 VUT family protein [Methanosarcina sp. MSH10X1]
MKSTNYKLQILLTIFISCLLLGNLLGNKLIEIFGIVTSVGFLGYPPTFLITDIVEEVKGKETTRIFVHAGFLSLCIAFIFVSLCTGLTPALIYQDNEAYTRIFSSSLRIIVASMAAFLISQHHDIWAFNFWKRKTNGRHLWLRNNLSTIISQLIDSTVFMFVAFYRVTPELNAATVIQMILPLWILKIGFALLDTPFVYLGVRWLASKNENSISDSERSPGSSPESVELQAFSKKA